MFKLHVKSDSSFGELEIPFDPDKSYSDGHSEFSSFRYYILNGKDQLNDWQPPIIKRLRPKKKLPDYIQVTCGIEAYSENAYNKLQEILTEGFFLPAEVEKTGEKVFFYRPPVLDWREVLNPESTIISLIKYQDLDPDSHAISLQKFLTSSNLNPDDWYLKKLGIYLKIPNRYPFFHFYTSGMNIYNDYSTPLCTLRFKNFVENHKLTGFNFLPIPYSVVRISETGIDIIESWSPPVVEVQTNQEPVSKEPEIGLDPNFIPSEADVLAFEKSRAIRFPEDYRQYVLKFNRGIPFPNELILQTEPPEESEEIPDIEFESWREIGFDFNWDVLPFYNESPKSIVIGRSVPQGDSFLMFLEEPYTSQVYFVSHECGENIYDTEGPDNNPVLQYVASSFSEFLSLIQAVSPETSGIT